MARELPSVSIYQRRDPSDFGGRRKTFQDSVHTNGNGNSTSHGGSQNSFLSLSGVTHDTLILNRVWPDWFLFRKKSETN
jgi:hypothetical protein